MKDQLIARRFASAYLLLLLALLAHTWRSGAPDYGTQAESVAVAIGWSLTLLIGVLFVSWRLTIVLAESGIVLRSRVLGLPVAEDVVPAASIREVCVDRAEPARGRPGWNVVRIVRCSGSQLELRCRSGMVDHDLAMLALWAARNGLNLRPEDAVRAR